MNLPTLLRRLAMALRDRDRRTLEATLDALSRRFPNNPEVAAFVLRLPSNDQAFLAEFVSDAADDQTRVGGASMPRRSRSDGAAVQSDPLASVPRDATSSKYMPRTAAQWATVLSVAGIGSGGPSYSWDTTVASGNLTDHIGGNPLAAGVGQAYQQAQAGWTAVGPQLSEAHATARFSLATTGGFADTQSWLAIFYIALTATPAATRSVLEYPAVFTEATAAPVYRANGAAGTNGAANPGTTVHPVILRSNVTVTLLSVLTDQEVINDGWFAAHADTFYVGGTASNGAPMRFLLGAAFRSAAAELSNAQVRTLLQTLGWAVAW